MNALTSLCLVALSACASPKSQVGSAFASDPAGKAQSLVLDFQTGFNRTRVALYLDRQQIFNGELTTDQRVGFARQFTFNPAHAKTVETEILLDQVARYSYSIEPERGRYVGFYRDLEQGRLHMEQRKAPFEYD